MQKEKRLIYYLKALGYTVLVSICIMCNVLRWSFQ